MRGFQRPLHAGGLLENRPTRSRYDFPAGSGASCRPSSIDRRRLPPRARRGIHVFCISSSTGTSRGAGPLPDGCGAPRDHACCRLEDPATPAAARFRYRQGGQASVCRRPIDCRRRRCSCCAVRGAPCHNKVTRIDLALTRRQDGRARSGTAVIGHLISTSRWVAQHTVQMSCLSAGQARLAGRFRQSGQVIDCPTVQPCTHKLSNHTQTGLPTAAYGAKP